ncbi:MAG: DUF4276 family protein, partial [Sedimentisphaerales bacterium]|nr:DUF4276 family protein [Sedimentisphaerales bacterium]
WGSSTMTEVKIAAIVEGHGECEAVPILIRRIALDIDPGFVPNVLQPLRVSANKLLREGEIERSITFTARKLQGRGGIIVIVDCDWDNGCPAKDGPALLKRAKTARNDLPISVILAKKEFEAWFLAAAESLRGKKGLPNDLEPPEDPESVRGAKEWLSDRMPPGKSYTETTDQPALTAEFDMNIARTADSFDKCYRDIRHMLETLHKDP